MELKDQALQWLWREVIILRPLPSLVTIASFDENQKHCFSPQIAILSYFSCTVL